MEQDQFKVREKALEEEFFARENARLKATFRQQLHDEETIRALERASGIRDQVVLTHMMNAGLTAETGAAFALLPLVLVAWVDGTLDRKEREAVLTAAREDGGMSLDDPSYTMLEHWLEAPPPPRLWRVWREYAEALNRGLDAEARQSLHRAVVDRAERVARATGGILGLGSPISRPERELLDSLEEVLRAGDAEGA